jgi:outer membrane protein assembly factor BamB
MPASVLAKATAAVVALGLLLPTRTTFTEPAAAEWPQFRGPNAGVAPDDPRLPETWSRTENVRWVADVAGRGWSSPVVSGEHVFVTTAINTRQPVQPLRPTQEYLGRSTGGTMSRADVTRDTDEFRWMLYDIDFDTGRVRWERQIHRAVPTRPVHQKNSYSTETPVTDGERIYVYLGYAGLFAFDMNGTPLWSTPMEAHEVGEGGWGSASSPVLHNGRIYIVNDNDEASFIAAFDAKTGRELWRVARDERASWSTPFVWAHAARTEIITTSSKHVLSYDTDGKVLWELRGMTSVHASTPFSSHGLLFLQSGYFTNSTRPAYAIRPGATGDISLKPGETSNAYIAWFDPTLASCYPSAIVVGDQYYTLMDRGFITSNDARTGKVVYGRQRLANDSGAFSASPWSYNGKIFAISEEGDTFVIQAGPEYKLLGRNSLEEMTLASPAIARGSLFIRTATKLYRLTRAS